MVRALIGVFLIVALTACGANENNDALPPEPSPSATEPATAAAPPPASPSAAPTATRPSRSVEEATGAICGRLNPPGGSEPMSPRAAQAGAAMIMLEIQAALPDLDEELAQLWDENSEEPAQALKLMTDWCAENGY